MDQHSTSKMKVYLVEDQALVRESMHTLFELVPEVALVGAAISAEQALMQLEVMTSGRSVDGRGPSRNRRG